MTVKEQLLRVLRSRKFWALLAALLTAAGGYASGEMSVWQAVQAAIAALAVYSTGVALEDSLKGVERGS
ncbi:MAG: hypothetical protein GYA48_07890 [Chloroflexi bacterium]|nr:hypothetical protein [Chloroflexota bacterium]